MVLVTCIFGDWCLWSHPNWINRHWLDNSLMFGHWTYDEATVHEPGDTVSFFYGNEIECLACSVLKRKKTIGPFKKFVWQKPLLSKQTKEENLLHDHLSGTTATKRAWPFFQHFILFVINFPHINQFHTTNLIGALSRYMQNNFITIMSSRCDSWAPDWHGQMQMQCLRWVVLRHCCNFTEEIPCGVLSLSQCRLVQWQWETPPS